MKASNDTPAKELDPATEGGRNGPDEAAQASQDPPLPAGDNREEAESQPASAPQGDSEDEADHRSRKGRKHGKRTGEEEAIQTRLLRLQADFDNFRKRTLREKNDLYTRANEDIMQELLPVLDHMDLALKAAREHDAPQSLLDGFTLVHEQLLSALKKFHLSVVDAEKVDFDPNLHEAVSHIASPDTQEGGVIAQVRKGYRLGDQLLRPAQVVVSSGPFTN